MPSFRKAIENMSGYTPGEQINRDVVKLNTNENPYPPSPRVAEALRDYGDDLLRRYPNPMVQDLLDAAARIYDFPVEGILAGNGSDDLLTILFRALLDTGSKVTTFQPTYTLYETLAELQAAELHYADFTDDFRIPDDFKDPDSRFVVLANPNSPSGTLVPTDRVAALAAQVNNILVVDEAYGDFAQSNSLDLARECENVVVLRSFSKSYSLAGVRLGLAFASPDIMAQLVKVKDSYNVNRLSMAAGIAALEDQQWMQANRDRIINTRADLIAGLKDLGLEPLPSEANFVYVRCPDGQASALYAGLKERSIFVRWFDRPLTRNALRITVGTDDEIQILLTNMRELITEQEK